MAIRKTTHKLSSWLDYNMAKFTRVVEPLVSLLTHNPFVDLTREVLPLKLRLSAGPWGVLYILPFGALHLLSPSGARFFLVLKGWARQRFPLNVGDTNPTEP